MPFESLPLELPGALADDAVADRRQTLPGPGDKTPCEGYWLPQCKKQAARHLKKGVIITPCRMGHKDEPWSLRRPGPGDVVY